MLATVVDVDGRAYRRPGATSVVSPESGGTGAVTAGCLTDEVRRLARDVLADGRARVETFDLGADDDAWGLGVGCNGVVDLLLEPLAERHRPALAAPDRGESVTAVAVLASDDDRLAVGDRAYRGPGGTEPLDATGAKVDHLPPAVADAVAAADVTDAAGADAATIGVETDRGRVRLFVERVAPPPHLVVIGSGQDVGPVVDLARTADFRVTVVGFRGARATSERFPAADRVVATSPRDLTDEVNVDDRTYAVLMTHNFVDDRLALGELLATEIPYVGVMGPEERYADLREALVEDGRPLGDEEIERVYAPVGLDLGAGTPRAVAHSVVGEVLAVHNDRTGGHLRDVDGPIHGRSPDE